MIFDNVLIRPSSWDGLVPIKEESSCFEKKCKIVKLICRSLSLKFIINITHIPNRIFLMFKLFVCFVDNS